MNNKLLREVGVLQGPEAKQTWLQLTIINTVNVELSITNRNEVRVSVINVHRGHLSAFSHVTFKREKRLHIYLTLFDFFLLNFSFIFFLSFLFHTDTALLLLTFLLIIGKVTVAKFDRWVILVKYVLFVESVLC